MQKRAHSPFRDALLFAGGCALALGAGYAIAERKRRRQFGFQGRTVIITGGSRGLGLIIARQLAEQGARLVLLARDRGELRRAEMELAKFDVPILTLECDLTDQGQVNTAIRRAWQEFGGIDVLINNAGIIQVGPLESMTLHDFEQCMAIHFYAPLYTTLAVLPYMRGAMQGRIVNVSSIGGKIAIPHMVPYAASKFALVGLSDGLRAELRRYNIFVTTVCPGLMRTGSVPNAYFKGQHKKEYAWFALSDAMPLLSISAESAARKIIRACQRGAARLIISPQAKAAVLLNELFPGATAELMAGINRLLPEPDATRSQKLHTGWESQSKLAPSILTKLSDKASERNNEGTLRAE